MIFNFVYCANLSIYSQSVVVSSPPRFWPCTDAQAKKIIRVNQTQSGKPEANAEMNSITVIASHGPITGEHSHSLCMVSIAQPFYITSGITSGHSMMAVEDLDASERDTWGHAISELQP